jgi:DNA (cytosine-5)-methyltransferase 1
VKAISLFSGIGGLDYGFQLAGIHSVLQVESDPVCLKILERHWPEVERIDDVRKVDAATWGGGCRGVVGERDGADAERLGGTSRGLAGIDLAHGGFPCQDVSVAGRRAGLSGERSGLWFEFHRVLRDLRPRWCVIENVPGLLSSNRGRDFGFVLHGLGELGYGWAYRVLDARWFGTPQRRHRVVVVGCLGDATRAASVLSVCEGCGGYPAARQESRQDPADAPAPSTRVDHHTQAFGGNRTSGPIDVAAARSSRGNRYDFDTDTFLVEEVASTLSSGSHPGSNIPGRHHEDDANLVVANPIRASDGHHGWSGPRGDGLDNLVADPISTREQKTYSHEGSNNFRTHNLIGGVRRLTPLECERLQGFPDGWTEGVADSHRYRMLGNAVDTVVAQWVGHRLAWVDAYG